MWAKVHVINDMEEHYLLSQPLSFADLTKENDRSAVDAMIFVFMGSDKMCVGWAGGINTVDSPDTQVVTVETCIRSTLPKPIWKSQKTCDLLTGNIQCQIDNLCNFLMVLSDRFLGWCNAKS